MIGTALSSGETVTAFDAVNNATHDRPCTTVHIFNRSANDILGVWVQGLQAGTVAAPTEWAYIPPNGQEAFRFGHNQIQAVLVYNYSGTEDIEFIFNVIARSTPLKS